LEPRRIRAVDGIVARIGIRIEPAGIQQRAEQRIARDEPPLLDVVDAPPHVDEPEVIVLIVPRVPHTARIAGRRAHGLSEGEEAEALDAGGAAGLGGLEGGGALVVVVEEGQGPCWRDGRRRPGGFDFGEHAVFAGDAGGAPLRCCGAATPGVLAALRAPGALLPVLARRQITLRYGTPRCARARGPAEFSGAVRGELHPASIA
jgi:hypothetical protein